MQVGINTLIGLPFITIAMIGSQRVFALTGSYDIAIGMIAGFFGLAIVLGLYGATGPKLEGPAAA